MTSAFVADFIAGWVGGIFCVVTGYPFDTVKVRQQNFSTSFWVAVRETFKYEGSLGFFKGMSSPLIAYGPSNSLFFGGTELFMKLLSGTDQAALNYNQQRTKFLWNIFASGCFGSLMQVIVMCPVELVKITLQTSTEGQSPWVHNATALKFESSTHTFKTIVALKGLRGLYKGFVPMIIRDVPTGGIYFVVYESLLPKNRKDVQWYHKIWAGGWAGITSISTVLPVDVVKTRMQADDLLNPHYDNMTDCIKKLYREEGIRFFWKGLPVITARAFPAHAMLFIGYDMTMTFLNSGR